MRLRTPNTSLLKQRERESRTPLRFFSLAACYLCAEDGANVGDIYRTGKGHLTHCVPTPNDFQQKLLSMFPRDKTIKLYINVGGLRQPTHYIVLHKQVDGLFGIKTVRMVTLDLGKAPKADGILLEWGNPDPDYACEFAPHITRVLGGGVSINAFAHEALNSRELSLAVSVAGFYTNKRDFAVWMHPGKVVFSVTGVPEHLWVQPHEFEIVSTRLYAKNVTKPYCILWGDVPIETMVDLLAPPLTRFILPQIRGTEEAVIADPTLVRFLSHALETRLLPYVFVKTGSNATLYALVYNPDTKQPYIATLGQRRASLCSNLPMVSVEVIDEAGVILPGSFMMRFLYDALFNDDTVLISPAPEKDSLFVAAKDEIFQSRYDAIVNIFFDMRFRKPQYIPTAFSNWGMELSPGDIETLNLLNKVYAT